MKIRELVRHWENFATGRLTRSPYQIHLDIEARTAVGLGRDVPQASPRGTAR